MIRDVASAGRGGDGACPVEVRRGRQSPREEIRRRNDREIAMAGVGLECRTAGGDDFGDRGLKLGIGEVRIWVENRRREGGRNLGAIVGS